MRSESIASRSSGSCPRHQVFDYLVLFYLYFYMHTATNRRPGKGVSAWTARRALPPPTRPPLQSNAENKFVSLPPPCPHQGKQPTQVNPFSPLHHTSLLSPPHLTLSCLVLSSACAEPGLLPRASPTVAFLEFHFHGGRGAGGGGRPRGLLPVDRFGSIWFDLVRFDLS